MSNTYNALAAAAFNLIDFERSFDECAALAGATGSVKTSISALLANIVAAYGAVENSDDDSVTYESALLALGVTGSDLALALDLIGSDLGGF